MFNIVKYNRPGNMFDLMGSFFNDFPSSVEKNIKYAPLVDIYEKENNFFVEAQLPGMKKEDVKIEIDNNVMLIKGDSCKEEEIKEDAYYRKEIIKGNFVRSFTLPDSVDKNKINAKFKDGVLKIEIPKVEKEESKKIEIN